MYRSNVFSLIMNLKRKTRLNVDNVTQTD